MSMLNYIVDKLKSGLITFINMVTLTNRDLPYHDAASFTSADTGLSYTVGTNQVRGHGDQRKLFVSKSTLIYSTENQTIRFNNRNNVAIPILANSFYEFKSNIYQVFYTLPTLTNTIYFYFEGVLPEEARAPQ